MLEKGHALEYFIEGGEAELGGCACREEDAGNDPSKRNASP